MSERDDSFLDDPFDDDDGWWHEPQDPEEKESGVDVSSLLREVGIDGYEQILLDITNVDPNELRGQRFDTIEEAIVFLYDIGVLSFAGLVEFDDDTYGYLIQYKDQ